ncbi:bifunctional 4-hydroxy-2-oxoglutarate aldolase/2-dehydro-3-deoxy-phosphogluconate aldolase [Thalassobacillus devorans]|uniref:bifunctional 4-hydroxy-2-oxoglutarate aldolase/2-dehydro-3-deoxy-phosphogluconate aldolase n=1 Tax=Thalassobacillus devorans TaxID=279813 RepID=UPI000A1C9BA9|nr:bifunctional 4-hydroxy-2-oxoglutarate aldolase/2-dehydro-3-deoxy-phosphogluconate aldolase [Thalassobacillus devorans]
MSVFERLKQARIVAVIRNADEENIIPIAEALHKGGVHALEITAETEHAEKIIEKVTGAFGDKLMIGAGTVLDPETARTMLLAGATFIVSPTLNTETIKITKCYGAPSIPGAFTPTEVLTAYEHGADMVKVFPAGTVGAGYIKSIKGPLPQIPLMTTGGIDGENMEEYFNNGAEVVGIGSQLVNPKQLNKDEDYDELAKRAASYVKKVSAMSVFN